MDALFTLENWVLPCIADRTGVSAAVLLDAAGAVHQEVVKDYAITRRHMRTMWKATSLPAPNSVVKLGLGGLHHHGCCFIRDFIAKRFCMCTRVRGR